MDHPQTISGGWKLKSIVYDDGPAGIAVGLFQRADDLVMALRWREDIHTMDKKGTPREFASPHNSETDWFIIPLDFAKQIGRELVIKKALGKMGFEEEGFSEMIRWLIECDGMFDGMCY